METCPIKQNVGGLERLACLAAGGWLLLKGILTRRTSRTVFGGLLVYRGLSGNCKAYEALGVDTRSAAEKAES
ncbi:MAG: YgaP family membrane protein [Chthoniobacterales bacterium]